MDTKLKQTKTVQCQCLLEWFHSVADDFSVSKNYPETLMSHE